VAGKPEKAWSKRVQLNEAAAIFFEITSPASIFEGVHALRNISECLRPAATVRTWPSYIYNLTVPVTCVCEASIAALQHGAFPGCTKTL